MEDREGMDRQTDRRTGGWTERGEQTDGWVDREGVDRQTDGRMGRRRGGG